MPVRVCNRHHCRFMLRFEHHFFLFFFFSPENHRVWCNYQSTNEVSGSPVSQHPFTPCHLPSTPCRLPSTPARIHCWCAVGWRSRTIQQTSSKTGSDVYLCMCAVYACPAGNDSRYICHRQDGSFIIAVPSRWPGAL